MNAGSESPPADAPAVGLIGLRLVEAIAAVEPLPLSDAERAEAVRRLLAATGAERG